MPKTNNCLKLEPWNYN